MSFLEFASGNPCLALVALVIVCLTVESVGVAISNAIARRR